MKLSEKVTVHAKFCFMLSKKFSKTLNATNRIFFFLENCFYKDEDIFLNLVGLPDMWLGKSFSHLFMFLEAFFSGNDIYFNTKVKLNQSKTF